MIFLNIFTVFWSKFVYFVTFHNLKSISFYWIFKKSPREKCLNSFLIIHFWVTNLTFLVWKKSPLSTQDKMRFRHFISASSFIWESCFWLILMIVFSNFLRRRRQKNVFPSSYHLEYMMAHCAIIYPLQLNWKKSNFLAFLGWAKAIILPSKTSTHMLINWSKCRNTFQTLFWVLMTNIWPNIR